MWLAAAHRPEVGTTIVLGYRRMLGLAIRGKEGGAMQTLSVADFALRLAVGVGCGALIGLERQWRARLAGLRTNALVAGGATLFVLYAVATEDSRPTRRASYVVSGVGFLGGGAVLPEGFNVRGLNTAATLWCSAGGGV